MKHITAEEVLSSACVNKNSIDSFSVENILWAMEEYSTLQHQERMRACEEELPTVQDLTKWFNHSSGDRGVMETYEWMKSKAVEVIAKYKDRAEIDGDTILHFIGNFSELNKQNASLQKLVEELTKEIKYWKEDMQDPNF